MGVFKILFWNANGLRPKLAELRDFVIDNPVDLILVQEVRSTYFRNLNIQNFKSFFTPRTDDNGISPYGGTAIFVNRRVSHAHIPSLSLNLLENTNIKIYLDQRNSFLVSSIYLRVSNHLDLPSDLNKLFRLDNNVILAGDFNSHHPSWCPNSRMDRLGETLHNYCINNGIEIAAPTSSTRFGPQGNGTTIDLALLNNISFPYTITPISALSSDHLPIQINIDCNPSLPSLITPFVYDWQAYTNSINDSSPPFSVINSVEDIEMAITNLTKLIQNSLEASKCHQVQQNYQALPHDIKVKIRKRNRIRRSWQINRDPSIRTDLNRLTAIIKRDIQNFKNSKWSDYISSLTPTDNSLWNYLKRVRKPFTPIPPLQTDAGHKCLDIEKVEVLADQYESQFQPHSDVFHADTLNRVDRVVSRFLAHEPVRSIEPTTPDEVITLIKNLPNRKAPGHDGITNSALKNLPLQYADYLATLINAIFKFQHFPEDWKKAIIVPIKKPGEDPSLARSYRPVSLLPVLSKLTEHIFLTRLQNFLPDIPEQFGFRPKHSTAHQLLRVVEYIHDGLENSEYVGSLFIDVAKAFDTVWLFGLIYKLLMLKVPTAYVRFIFKYLHYRTFCVRYANISSTPHPVNAGVPQGSKLGPWLYKAYIADIPTSPHTLLAIYADDTTVMARHKNCLFMNEYLQQHIHKLESFFTKWRIKINSTKSQAVIFTRNRTTPPPLYLNGSFINFGREVKYLGVFLDSTLTWRKQIENSVQKFYKAKQDLAHLLYSNEMGMENKILLYKTVLRPILLYCAQIWGSAAKTNLQKIQVVQNKTLRGIIHSPWYRRNTAIHHDLNIPPIRSVIKCQSIKFFENIPNISNPALQNLSVYDDRTHWKRPRATLHLPENIDPG